MLRISAIDLRDRLLPIVLTQGIGLACGLAGVRLVSRWVQPGDYGAYGVFVSLATVGSGVIYAGLVKYVSRHWHECADRAGLVRRLARAIAGKTVWLAVTVGVIAGVVPSPDRVQYGAALFAAALLLGLVQLVQSALQAAREHWRDTGVAGTLSLLRSFGPPLLYVWTGAGLFALLSGFLLHALAGAMVGAWHLRVSLRGALHCQNPASIRPVYEGHQFVLLALITWLLLGLNRWLVAGLHGTEAAGLFLLAANIGAILPTVLGSIMLQFFQPRWFGADTASPGGRLRLVAEVDRIGIVYTSVAVLLAALLHACMPWLIGPLIAPRYGPAVEFVFCTGNAAAALVLASFFHAMLMAARAERACLTADLVGAVVLIAGSLASAIAGLAWFKIWLGLSPLVPWTVHRTVARRALLHLDRK